MELKTNNMFKFFKKQNKQDKIIELLTQIVDNQKKQTNILIAPYVKKDFDINRYWQIDDNRDQKEQRILEKLKKYREDAINRRAEAGN